MPLTPGQIMRAARQVQYIVDPAGAHAAERAAFIAEVREELLSEIADIERQAAAYPPAAELDADLMKQLVRTYRGARKIEAADILARARAVMDPRSAPTA